MVNKITTPPTQNEVIDKINELVDGKQDNISDLATIRSGATGNVKLDGGSATQTVSLTSGTGTTALGVKSKSTSSYISFSASGGWLASFGITSDKKPTIYDGTSHVIAYTTDIPTNNNQLTNGAGYITSSALTPYALSADLATVATSGNYNDLSNKPTIPTVNNATLTIQKNGTNVATFTANASSNVTANISVPTKVSDLTNDSGFITGITSSDVTTALGYTPYNSSNPSGYQANVIETVKVNGTALTPSSKAVDISVPTTTSSVTSGSSAALTSGGAYTALQSYQTTANLVTSVSSSSTNSQYPSAKLFYDTCGDIETLINAL